MRSILVATVTLALALTWTAAGHAQRTADQLYQAGLYQEEVAGNLQRAIEIYRSVLRAQPPSRAAGAKAQLHIGLCYEALGLTEAQRAYQRVIDQFADQSDAVRQARARLAALRPAAVAGRGPDARRLLSSEETDFNNFFSMMPSPDGRRVAYTQVGSDQGLYVRDLATGEEERLASGLPRVLNLSPIWSPDGRRLAFLEADRESGSGVIKIIDVASHNAILVPGTSAQHQSPRDVGRNLNPLDWSRDGRFLLCRTVGARLAGGIVLIPVDGGTSIPVADSVTPNWQATVSPDGRFVAYSVGVPDSAQVFIRSLGGGEPRRITEAPGGNGSPVWSPDGRALAYARSDGIWVVPMESGRPAGTPRLAYASTFWPRFPFAWTAAGGLYFTAWSGGSPVPYRFPVDPATGRPGAAAPDQLPGFPSRGLGSFAWSPDMRRVAFAGQPSPEITIYSEEQHTLTAHRVDPEPAGLAGWSSDGREVLYASSNSMGVTWEAFDPAAGRVRELFPRRADRAVLSLSADGRRMLYGTPAGLFVADTGQADGLLVAPTDQGGALLSRMRMMRSRLSPRGDQVLFGRQSNLSTGRYDPAAGTVWVVASDGTGLRRVGTPVYVITSAVWDPSGRFIAYSGIADSTTNVLRVVEVATGAEREFRLPDTRAQFVGVTSWSPDGRYLGVVIPAVARAEYWVVQGLQAGAR